MKKSRKSGSGGSSILKASLRAHSDSNISLNQESPATSKIKRRVSFAEKNHVKEFLYFAEQGILWNDTYEESSNKNAGQIDVNNQNYETPANIYHSTSSGMTENENGNLMNDSLEFTECIVTPGSIKLMHTEDILLKKSISLTDQNKNYDKETNISIESNRNIDICAHKSINVYPNISSLHNTQNPDLNKTCIEDVSMEVTEIPSVIKFPNVLPIKRKLESEDKENIPMSDIIIQSNVPSISTNEMNAISDGTQYFRMENLEFTECLQSIKEPLHLQHKINEIRAFTTNENVTNNQTQTEIFKNVSMEMTCAIPSVCRQNSTDHTVVFHDAPMDDTSIVTSAMNKKEKSISKYVSQIENDTRKIRAFTTNENVTNNQTQTEIFKNVSMEMTCAIPSVCRQNSTDHTVVFHDAPMDDTSIVTSVMNKKKKSISKDVSQIENDTRKIRAFTNNENVTNNQAQTEIFNNVSMEMTCAIPSVCRQNSTDHTVVFHDAPMDDTSIVTSVMNKKKKSISKDVSQIENDTRFLKKHINSINKTSIMDASMDITEGIYSLPQSTKVNNVTHIGNPLNCDNSTINDKTKLNDDSLEFTVPVNNLSRVVHNIDREELSQFAEMNACTMPNEIRILSEKKVDAIENGLSENNSLNINISIHSNPISSTITSNTIVNATIQNNSTFKHAVNENIKSNLLQNENNNLKNQISNVNEKLVKHDYLLDSMCTITRRDHSMNEVEKQPNIQFNSSNDNVNKSVHQKADDIISSSCTTYCNDDIESIENISTENQPVHALTSLISSFVYADMIEDDSFVKTIHEVQQETQSIENVIDVNSLVDIVNVQTTSIQSLEKCIVNDERQKLENYLEDNNVQVGNALINKEKNNQHDSDKVSTKINEIHENVFESSINNKRLINTPTKLEITQRDKQLDEINKSVNNNSAACIVKSKQNSDMDISEHVNIHNSNNQILCGSRVLSPTLISSCNQNKTCIEENNITLTVDTTDLTCSMDVIQNNDNNYLREEIDHVTLEENTGNNSSFQENKFSSLVNKLKIHMHNDDCIWNLHYENIDKEMIVVGFISTSLLIIIYTQNDVNTDTCVIKDVNVISQLENDENLLLSIAHKLITEKINIEHIRQSYKYEEDIIPLLNHISEDVKSILDFIFDLKQLEDTNLMEINTENITFISRSKSMDIILKIKMDIKLFDKINSSDIKVVSILGAVIEKDIQELFTNVKRDHTFLRRYMSDIKDYIDIIEEVNLANKKYHS